MPAVALLAGVAGLFLLKMAGILEDQRDEPRCWRAVDRPVETLLHQPRKQSGVVEMGMGQHTALARRVRTENCASYAARARRRP